MKAAEGLKYEQMDAGVVAKASNLCGIDAPEKLSQSARRSRAYGLRWWLRALAEAGSPDLTKLVQMPKAPWPRNVVPTPQELNRYLKCPDLGLRWLLLCYAHCALRSGTASRVTIAECIDGTIRRRTKFGATVEVSLTPEMHALVVAVAIISPQSMAVCEALAGRKYVAETWRLRMVRWRKQCGVRDEVKPHDLRRGLARHLYAVTGDVRQVQSLLGHSTAWSSFHYLGGHITDPLQAPSLDEARKRASNGP